MACPLQNYAILQSFLQDNYILQYSLYSQLDQSPVKQQQSQAPSFNQYAHFQQHQPSSQQHQPSSQASFLHQYSHFQQQNSCSLVDSREQQIQNSIQLDLLRKKMMQIEQLSKLQVQKCKRQILQQNKLNKHSQQSQKNNKKTQKQSQSLQIKHSDDPPSQQTKQSNNLAQQQANNSKFKGIVKMRQAGTNTDRDYRDEQILLLKQLLRHQSNLNKHLLNKYIQKDNIYDNVIIQ